VLGLGAVAALTTACSGRTNHDLQQAGGTNAGTPNAGGKSAASGSSASAVGGDATSGGVSAAGTPTAGSGASLNEGGATQAGTAGVSGGGEAGGAPLDPDAILKVRPSPGCGKDPLQQTGVFTKYTIQTSGVKEPNCADHLADNTPKCGAWSLARDYYVWLPPDYKNTTPYELVLQGPGCGGNGTNVASLSPTNDDMGSGVNGTVIRVGLSPPPISIGHGTNPGQGCFDDKEGDDSVDLVFYESLIDKLKTELCYDENRVFVSGNSSGAWLANELACKYAGDQKGHAIRGVITDGGGLPNQPQFSPTCSNAPRAGFWVWTSNDFDNVPDPGVKFAIARAMKANGCVASSDYDDAVAKGVISFYPVGAGIDDAACGLIKGCPSQYPLVACVLKGSGQSAPKDPFNPGAATFLKALAAP
jgi:hypothetical protein